jgi:hypothetical protein
VIKSLRLWVLGFVVLTSGCAAQRFQFPTDPGTPLPDFANVYMQVAAACGGARTLTAELSLSGHAGGQNLRGRVIAGFARPASMRLEGVAPFGPPAFILVARDAGGTLLLPRDNRVLQGVRAEEILCALTGVALSPVDLQAILTGCVIPAGQAAGGRLHRSGLASLDLMGGATLYLEREGARWRVRAATRPGWDVEYPEWQGDFPGTVRLRSRDQRADVDLTAGISQVEANIDLAPDAFNVSVPDRAVPLTLDELRANGPIRSK